MYSLLLQTNFNEYLNKNHKTSFFKLNVNLIRIDSQLLTRTERHTQVI